MPSRDCRRCYFSQVPALDDRFYLEAVRPYCWFAAVLLFLSYVIGLWFTLRTHAAVIWNSEVDEKKAHETHHVGVSQQMSASQRLQRHGSTQNTSNDTRAAEIRDSQLYKRILGQSLKQAGLALQADGSQFQPTELDGQVNVPQTPHIPPPKSAGEDSVRSTLHIPGLTEEQNSNVAREVAEMAATAATIAARDATKPPRKTSITNVSARDSHKPPTIRTGVVHEPEEVVVADAHAGGGHDAPNWSRMKSSIILCGATLLYAMIAEILVNTVDTVLENVAIDEKFLGITLFALVPNTTEFLVSISSHT